ncbi:MAG: CDP-diacylglycerol--glycerol-3-phosphate 3-phosphatidyltransferase [Candidatus Omnitrophica bacterium]|nr:CDP-diacylglycerol--glycerol-3-phosphate 3-phosphatidyltransferase [Candidatus Omnitrophota bacterium]
MSIPNYLTLLRILLTPVFFIALISYGPGKEHLRFFALAIFALAAVTDALDGLLARYLRQRTELGRLLDPLADKVLLLSGFIGLFFVSALPYKPPLWITITIIFRDVFLLVGFFSLHFLSAKIAVSPNRWGKMTTLCQMLLLCFILLELPLVLPVAYLTVFFTIISGVIYISKGLKVIE